MPTRWQTWSGRMSIKSQPTQSSWKMKMSGLRPWSRTYKPWRTLQNHQLTIKLLLRRLTAMTLWKSINDMWQCSRPWMRRKVAWTMLTLTHGHGMEHDKRLPRHSRAENCQRSDILKYPGGAGRPQTVCEKDWAGVPKAAGWPVAGGETPSCHQEAVAACIGGCLLFLECSVKTTQNGSFRSHQVEKVNDPLNKV